MGQAGTVEKKLGFVSQGQGIGQLGIVKWEWIVESRFLWYSAGAEKDRVGHRPWRLRSQVNLPFFTSNHNFSILTISPYNILILKFAVTISQKSEF